MDGLLTLDDLNSHEIERIGNQASQFAGRSLEDQFNSLEQLVLNASQREQYALLNELLHSLLEGLKECGKLVPQHILIRRLPKLSELIPKVYSKLYDELRLPGHIGRYRVLQLIGEGGQARAVVGVDDSTALEDEATATRYAIKFSTEEDATRRLEHEAEIQKMLQPDSRWKSLVHTKTQRIRGFIEYGVDDREEPRIHYLALEYLEGDNFASRFRQFPVQPKKAVRLILDVANAVSAMHRRNILHRDIKPENAIMSRNGRAKLIDVGLAINMSRGGAKPLPIREFGGTLNYMPPEQLYRRQISSPKASDVYSLGATLYFLLTGEHPEGHLTEEQITRLQSDQDIIETRPKENIHAEIHNRNHIPYQLREICWKAMQSEFQDRYVDAEAFAAALRSYQIRNSRSLRIIAGLAVVACIAVAFLVWPSSSAQPTLVRPSQNLRENALQTFLAENGLTVEDFSMDNFDISLEKGEIIKGAGLSPRHLLCLRCIDIPEDLLGTVEYRMGKRMWGSMFQQLADGRYYAMLSDSELNSDQPIELRIDSLVGHETGFVIGPWTSDLVPRDVLRTEIEARKAAFNRAANSEWLFMTPNGWSFSPRSGIDIMMVDEVRVGHEPSRLDFIAKKSGYQFAVQNYPPYGVDHAMKQVEAELNSRLMMNPKSRHSTVFMQLVSVDGIETKIRSFTSINPRYNEETWKQERLKETQSRDGAGGISFPSGARRKPTGHDDAAAAASKYRTRAPAGGLDP